MGLGVIEVISFEDCLCVRRPTVHIDEHDREEGECGGQRTSL